MRKHFNIALIMIMLCLVVVSAQEADIRFFHERNTNLTIFEKCRVDGFICDVSYSCDLTILDPSQVLVVDQVSMTDEGVYQTFNLTANQSEINGVHEATVDCTNTTFSGSNTFNYEITPSGSAPVTQSQSLILIAAVSLLILVSLFFGFLGFKSTNTTIMLSFISFAVLIMVFTLGLIVNVVELSFGTFLEVVGNFSTVYILFTVLLSVAALGLIMYIIVVVLNYYWTLRGMKDTISVR